MNAAFMKNRSIIFRCLALSVLIVSLNTSAKCPDNIDTLATYNIALADIPRQASVVKEWLANPYSGYPALLTKICFLMDGQKLIGNAPSLMVINHNNVILHNRNDSDPLTNEDQIDLIKLKQAVFDAWKQKNSAQFSGLPANSTFDNILIGRLSVSITKPTNRSRVNVNDLITGNVSRANSEVWLVVKLLDTTICWVQNPVDVDTSGLWEALVWFGEIIPENSGKSYEIRAIANPESALLPGPVHCWPKAEAMSAPIYVQTR